MEEFQELTKAINDNSACLVQLAKNMDQNNHTLIECTRQICREVGSIDLDHDSNKGKMTGVGHIRIFDGNPKQYEDWVKEIEKTAFLSNASDRKRQLLAYQLNTGLVSDYIKRYLESDEQKIWDHMKINLASRFSTEVEGQRAFEILVNVWQKKDEDIQFCAERLLGAAQRAYPHQTDHTRPIIESQLLSIFLAGI